jgi:hypothetical protein
VLDRILGIDDRAHRPAETSARPSELARQGANGGPFFATKPDTGRTGIEGAGDGIAARWLTARTASWPLSPLHFELLCNVRRWVAYPLKLIAAVRLAAAGMPRPCSGPTIG